MPPVLRKIARRVLPDSLLQARYQRYFFEIRGGLRHLHFGKFASIDEAQALVRAQGRDGCYVIDQAQWSMERSATYFTHDYPVLFWLDRLIQPGGRLVDLGGSTGVTYRLLKSRLELPADFEWQVQDLPDVIDYARSLNNGDGALAHLSFTDDWRAIDGASIVLCAGALQFFPRRLSEMLADVYDLPAHLIVNRVPLTENGLSYVTLQNTGLSIAPMRVESRSAFLENLAHQRYEMVDEWKCLENALDVPFNPECDLRYYRGYYFRRIDRVGSHVGVVLDSDSGPRANDARTGRPRRHPVLHPVAWHRRLRRGTPGEPPHTAGVPVRTRRSLAARHEAWPACFGAGRNRATRVRGTP